MIHWVRAFCLFMIVGAAGGVDRGTMALFPAAAVCAAALLVWFITGMLRTDNYDNNQHRGDDE